MTEVLQIRHLRLDHLFFIVLMVWLIEVRDHLCLCPLKEFGDIMVTVPKPSSPQHYDKVVSPGMFPYLSRRGISHQ